MALRANVSPLPQLMLGAFWQPAYFLLSLRGCWGFRVVGFGHLPTLKSALLSQSSK